MCPDHKSTNDAFREGYDEIDWYTPIGWSNMKSEPLSRESLQKCFDEIKRRGSDLGKRVYYA